MTVIRWFLIVLALGSGAMALAPGMAEARAASPEATTAPTTMPGIVDMWLPRNAPPDLPQVELCFYTEAPSGKRIEFIPPERSGGIMLRTKDNEIVVSYPVTKQCMRVGVGERRDGPILQWNRNYICEFVGESGEISAELALRPVARGEVRRYDLVFKKAEPPVQTPAIEGKVLGLPKLNPDQGKWTVGYCWGGQPWGLSGQVRRRDIGAAGDFGLADVPMGGELSILSPDEVCIAYIRKVDKAVLSLPRDATSVIGERDKMRRVLFVADKLPEGTVTLGFFADATARIPLGIVGVQGVRDDRKHVPEVRLPPGTYVARALVSKSRSIQNPTTRTANGAAEHYYETPVLQGQVVIGAETESVWLTEH